MNSSLVLLILLLLIFLSTLVLLVLLIFLSTLVLDKVRCFFNFRCDLINSLCDFVCFVNFC